MNSKKIWLIAMVFGLIAAGMMYFLVTENTNQTVEPATTVTEEDEADEENAKTAKASGDGEESQTEEPDEFTGNEMIPVSEGNRAMTMEVTDVTGVAGFIEAGAFVDVVGVMTVPEEYRDTQHDSATLLLENVKVLAIGHAADDKETMKRYQMVTVELSPKQGLALGFATRYELYLMLRQEGDNKLAPKDTHIHEDELHEGVFK
ncbi:Flp pilus assembly protein CpaB [Virgibacillus salinus]|uniref:Pilus assembly protein CpaB n=1 Tax=Virgibacillus salinus TaxID=553311 RepID=A0A1H0XYG6_9BACI|nr:Flp pilus assembly protein CpaB [Virgibacillus salinus]SDQ07875.1 pilus assembly protein CpaB [Virgibacillus salinus]